MELVSEGGGAPEPLSRDRALLLGWTHNWVPHPSDLARVLGEFPDQTEAWPTLIVLASSFVSSRFSSLLTRVSKCPTRTEYW